MDGKLFGLARGGIPPCSFRNYILVVGRAETRSAEGEGCLHRRIHNIEKGAQNGVFPSPGEIFPGGFFSRQAHPVDMGEFIQGGEHAEGKSGEILCRVRGDTPENL